jgi:hypothetical protein
VYWKSYIMEWPEKSQLVMIKFHPQYAKQKFFPVHCRCNFGRNTHKCNATIHSSEVSSPLQHYKLLWLKLNCTNKLSAIHMPYVKLNWQCSTKYLRYLIYSQLLLEKIPWGNLAIIQTAQRCNNYNFKLKEYTTTRYKWL